ncbi:DUF4258 domain-containing protein [Methylomonas sp. AM2-LC]|uniref:DUF4258 domain-containing protein n=1 Tax=Methylomonas sp. AM2-LC TaxID=3153301 RepID=UPI003262DC42
MKALGLLLDDIQTAINADQILWKRHTLERMLQRSISRQQVKQAILAGMIIECYPDDHPIPSLLLATGQPEALHVVLGYDANTGLCHIITAYRPNLTHFEADLTTRRIS